MIHDARTNPQGLHLPIDQWARDPRIRQLAAQRGFVIPPLRRVASDATPARALVNHGTWKAFCPDCIGSAEDLWRQLSEVDGQLVSPFFCMRCGNASCGGAWRWAIWPSNYQEIEAILDPLPVPTQNWEPWGEPRDPVAEAEAWLEHARVTIDPEHGLTQNEVGGADDPEIWTAPFLATTNAIIASSDCNAGYRGNLLWIRQFLSGEPPGGGYWLESSSTSAGGWVARATAVLAALGYTPLNNAGGTMTGDLVFGAIKGVVFRGNGGATPSGVRDYAAQGLVFNAHGDSVEIYDQALGNQIARFFRAAGVSRGWIGGYEIYHAGNLPAGGAYVPSGAVVWFETLAQLTAAGAGWSRYTAADGRILIGAGTTFGQTFTEATNYGSAWDLVQSLSGTGSGSTAGGTTSGATASGTITSGAASGPNNTGSANSATGPGTHATIKADATLSTLNGAVSVSVPGLAMPSVAVSVGVGGSTNAAVITPPSRAGVWGRKS